MNEIVAAAKQHLAAMESRIARQSALIKQLKFAGDDATEAIHNLKLMEHALEAMRATLVELVNPNSTPAGPDSVGKRKRTGRKSVRVPDPAAPKLSV